MPKTIAIAAASAIAFLFLAGGCKPAGDDKPVMEASPGAVAATPIHLKGTVGQYAVLFGGGSVNLQGYGLIIALGENGSSEVPSHLVEYYDQMLSRRNMGRYSYGTQSINPGRILRDKDTAPALLAATVPPGAPVGSGFDVYISSFPQSQTRTLDGGFLMPAGMRLAFAGMA